MLYYAVARGRVVGIFPEWHMCDSAVKAFSGARYKKFQIKQEAIEFLKQHNVKYEDRDSENTENSSQEVYSKATEFWPEDVECDDKNEEFLLTAAAEVEGVPVTSKKSTGILKRKKFGNETVSPSKTAKYESQIWEPIGFKKYGNLQFPIDSEGYVICYTDGSCEGNGKRSSCSWVWSIFFRKSFIKHCKTRKWSCNK